MLQERLRKIAFSAGLRRYGMLSGKNIQLKLIEESDLDDIVGWRNQAYDIFYEFPFSLERQQRWFKKYQDSGDMLFVIMCGESSIGTVGLNKIDLRNGSAEFGRFIIGEKDYLGKGYGKQAINVVLEYGFQHLNLNRVYLDCLESNSIAMKLYYSVGFVKEGMKREHIYKNGVYLNLICMSLLKKDWVRK